MSLIKKEKCEKCGKSVRFPIVYGGGFWGKDKGRILLCSDCYNKLKHPEKANILLETSATYWGGHMKYPLSGLLGGIGEFGDIRIVEKEITFVSSRKKWVISMPMGRVLWDKVLVSTEKDIGYEQKMSGMAFFATGLPMTTYSQQATYFTIPYKDKNNVIQSPKFQVKKAKELSEILYHQISKAKKAEKPKEDEENPLEILKVRFAKGQISKKEFEEMKKELA